jgi:hypothetical protein
LSATSSHREGNIHDHGQGTTQNTFLSSLNYVEQFHYGSRL